MTEFTGIVHELGEELFGASYLWMRPHVEKWARDNPERVAWLEQRIKAWAGA